MQFTSEAEFGAAMRAAVASEGHKARLPEVEDRLTVPKSVQDLLDAMSGCVDWSISDAANALGAPKPTIQYKVDRGKAVGAIEAFGSRMSRRYRAAI